MNKKFTAAAVSVLMAVTLAAPLTSDTDNSCTYEYSHLSDITAKSKKSDDKKETYSFILNKDTLCLHGSSKCRAAKKIKKDNYDEIELTADEFETYSKDGYWACSVSGCNSKSVREALPKPKSKKK